LYVLRYLKAAVLLVVDPHRRPQIRNLNANRRL
jgi:hypothetical protein